VLPDDRVAAVEELDLLRGRRSQPPGDGGRGEIVRRNKRNQTADVALLERPLNDGYLQIGDVLRAKGVDVDDG
jgi:hypothetical protein